MPKTRSSSKNDDDAEKDPNVEPGVQPVTDDDPQTPAGAALGIDPNQAIPAVVLTAYELAFVRHAYVV